VGKNSAIRAGRGVHGEAFGPERVCLHDAHTGQWLDFSRPYRVITAGKADEVRDCLREVERLVADRGWAAAGFLAYEAAPAFDTALRVHPEDRFPLLRFGLYPPPDPVDMPESAQSPVDPAWRASVSPAEYLAALERVQRYIEAGDTYQVNYTYRLCAPFCGNAWALFAGLAAAHGPQYGGFIQTPDWAIVSLSPELFFRRSGETIESIPMKGTIGRALTAEADLRQGERLQQSGKDRAENVMIVDMVRNDLNRIARPGSVRAENLFAVQRYPTLWQMISTVSARTDASLDQIFAALFPAASITGAPKARTMAIINELESDPRRIYTGTIGFLLPNRRAQFNVAIRTLLIDRRNGTVEYGVGGGITADSSGEAEWEETRLKSLICRSRIPDFSLLETLLWTPEDGYAYLPEHLHRLSASADYFSYPCSVEEIRAQLAAAVAGYRETPQRVRLLLDRKGKVRIEAVPCAPIETTRPVRVALAPHPIDDRDVFLYHKTTRREVYDRLRAGLAEGVDDVLLYNRRGEITETTIANIVVSIDGRQYTPPVHCGLLAGTCRRHLLASGQVTERVLSVDCIRSFGAFTLINSVRGRYPGILVPD
jgi:para-aminobenzoate synthetase / 4-amino-4-deoxychorismate lyase